MKSNYLQVFNAIIPFNHVLTFIINQKPVRNFLYVYQTILNDPGKYWIDPNHGSASDAIEVHCIIESGRKKTCLQPHGNSGNEVRKFYLSPILQLHSLSRSIMDQSLKFVFFRILYNQIEQNFTSECHDRFPANITVISLDDIHYNLDQISNLIISNECQVTSTDQSHSSSHVLPYRINSKDRSNISSIHPTDIVCQ